MLSYQNPPTTEVTHPRLEKTGIRLLVKREDLNHPAISGNKWWKLKYNVQEALRQKHHTLLTYGGAFSNHIYATAAAAKELGLNSIGIIRGELTLPLNPTLQFATQCGMKLHYITRSAYRDINSAIHEQWLLETFGDCYRIPEGGTNSLAVRGCEEWGTTLDATDCDFVCLPVGTGGTLAGITKGTSLKKRVLGISVLKEGGFLQDDITKLSGVASHRWQLLTEYAYGGYAKRHPAVTAFMEDFDEHTHIPLDFIYTGKMMCAIFDLATKRYFPRGSTVLALHTGGLQGQS